MKLSNYSHYGCFEMIWITKLLKLIWGFPFWPAKGKVPASQGKSSRRMGLWVYPQCLYSGWGGKARLKCHIGNFVADNWRCHWTYLIKIKGLLLLTFWTLIRYPDPSGLPCRGISDLQRRWQANAIVLLAQCSWPIQAMHCHQLFPNMRFESHCSFFIPQMQHQF